MQTTPRLFGTALLLCLPLAQAGADILDQVEIPVRRVFFPVRGYDDNDNIQMIVEGDLPDPCYVIGKRSFSRNAATGVITVRQYAWRRQTGACASGDLLESIPFSEELSIGRLPASDYRVAFKPDDTTTNFRPLNVSKATITTTDDLNYARVTNLKTPDLAIGNEPVTVELSGPLSLPCNELKLPLNVRREGDTFIILPTEIEGSTTCVKPLRGFEATLDLGVLPPGEYLVHVRSKNGKAVEKTVEVREKP